MSQASVLWRGAIGAVGVSAQSLRVLRVLRSPARSFSVSVGRLSGELSPLEQPAQVPAGAPDPCSVLPATLGPFPRPEHTTRYCLTRGNLPKEQPAVVVIGAGVAGLTAAAHLVDGGFTKVTVLEARSQPGGRIRSSFLGDSVIELGASWDSYDHVFDNPVIAEAVRDGFLPSTWGGDGDVFESCFRGTGLTPANPYRMDVSRTLLVDEEGRPYPRAVSYRAYLAAKNIETSLMGFLKDPGDRHGREHGDMSGLAGHLVRVELQRAPEEHRTATARILVGLLCTRRMRSSRDHRFLEHDDLGAHLTLPTSGVRVPLGYIASIGPQLKTLQDLSPDAVRYGKAVDTILWGAVGKPRALVRCQDGEEFPADHVIVTLPLGVLQGQHRHMFSPPLPCDKVEAIDRLRMTAENKVFLDFGRSFWLWMPDPQFQIRAPSPGTPGTKSIKSSWVRSITEMQAAPGSSHVVSASVLGEGAKDLEFYSDDELVEALTQVLRDHMKDSSIPYPNAIRRTSWSLDPQACGAMAEISGTDGARLSRQLASPVLDTLLFAGEATWPLHGFPGTVRGAALSGVREAGRLLERRRDARDASIFCVQRLECAA